ncbi:MAG: hypothetical protein WCX82_01310 [archaeon]|jgi:hypothetical protein
MNRNTLFVVSIILCLFITPLISAKEQAVLSILTTPDKDADTYYVSNYSTREITFESTYNLGNNQEGKAVYSLQVSPDTSGLDIELSTIESNFINDLDSKEVLYINTEKLTGNKTVQLRVSIFDNYNNLLSTKVKFLKLVPNNSNDYYEYTKDHTAPKYIGYNLSRKVSVINGYKDSDLISIFTTTEDGYVKDITCISSNSAIVTNLIYKDSKQTDLNISIDVNGTLQSGDYIINCFVYNAYDKEEVAEIKLRYTNIDYPKPKLINIDINKSTSKSIDTNSSVTPKNSVTGFLGLPKTGNLTYVLFVIFILLLVLILFSKD